MAPGIVQTQSNYSKPKSVNVWNVAQAGPVSLRLQILLDFSIFVTALLFSQPLVPNVLVFNFLNPTDFDALFFL